MKTTNSVKCSTETIETHLRKVAIKNTVTLQVFPEKGSDSDIKPHYLVREVNHKTVEEIAALSMKHAVVSAVPQRTDGEGRRAENVRGIRYLVVDIDKPTTMAEIKKLEAQPCMVVETSEGRFHLYFRVKCKKAEYKQYAHAIAEALGGDKQVCDPARAFRIAGTINWKSDPVRAKLRRCREQEPFPITELAAQLGVPVEPKLKAKRCHVEGKRDRTSEGTIRKLLRDIPANNREVWLHVGMALHSWSSNAGRALWDEWAGKCADKYNAEDQERTWSGFRQGARSIGTLYYYAQHFGSNPDTKRESWLPVVEDELARYAATVLSGRLRIVGETQYYVFGPHHWRCDAKGAVRLVLDIVAELRDAAEAAGNDYAKRRLQLFASFPAAQRLLKDLLAFPELDAKPEDFDSKPTLLGVSNGIVDLKTGLFRAGTPDDMITLATPTAYNAEEQCPGFRKFLRSIMDNKEFRNYFQRACGYWLLGEAPEQLAFIMLGKGSNGKGTITRLTEAVLGRQYVTTLSPSFVKNATRGNPNGPTPALMTLQKARLIWCTESEKKNGVDHVFFKQLTGNDTLTGRHNYGEQQAFRPPGKFVLTTNEMPDWPYDDQALWRRVRVLPFNKRFTEKNGRNNNLDSELAAEAAGVLNWMIDGAKRYLASGLGDCGVVMEATADARRRSDTVVHWISMECVKSPKAALGAKEAYDAYLAFAKLQGFRPVTVRTFKENMARAGFDAHRTSAGIRYRGLMLRE